MEKKLVHYIWKGFIGVKQLQCRIRWIFPCLNFCTQFSFFKITTSIMSPCRWFFCQWWIALCPTAQQSQKIQHLFTDCTSASMFPKWGRVKISNTCKNTKSASTSKKFPSKSTNTSFFWKRGNWIPPKKKGIISPAHFSKVSSSVNNFVLIYTNYTVMYYIPSLFHYFNNIVYIIALISYMLAWCKHMISFINCLFLKKKNGYANPHWVNCVYYYCIHGTFLSY